MTDIQATPAKIAAAIIAIKKQVKQLGSDEKNEHGGYRYVSVDKFYERIGPMMAEAGLALLIDETETDVRNGATGKPWLFAQYNLAFMHESGETSAPMRRSLAMPINGPQTYGAAQSYIEKQFLRQVFKIPTGEKDADDTAQDQEAPAGRTVRPQTNGATRTAAAPPPPARPAHVNGAALPPHPEENAETTQARQRIKMLIDRLDHNIKGAKNSLQLDTIMDGARGDLDEIGAAGPNGQAAASMLRSKYARRSEQLKDAEAMA